jgi:hypothetical protein
VRLQFSKFGVRRALGAEQVARAARVFQADQKLMSAGKQILNSKDPVWLAVTGPIGKARLFWRTMTVPYPVKGIRLLRRDMIPTFDQTLESFARDLAAAKKELEAAYVSLRLEAQNRLGQLFDQADYPETVSEDFTLEWDYPSVEPPDYLKELNPALWEQERQRLENRFAEAAALAENAFAAELQELVSHLVDRMTLDDDGKKKRLNKKAVEGFKEFFERFQSIRVGNNSQLDSVVAEARQVIDGMERLGLDVLRGKAGGDEAAAQAASETVRQNVASQMTALREQLDTMLIERPKRQIELEDE